MRSRNTLVSVGVHSRYCTTVLRRYVQYSIDRAVMNRVMPLGSEPPSLQFHARGAINPVVQEQCDWCRDVGKFKVHSELCRVYSTDHPKDDDQGSGAGLVLNDGWFVAPNYVGPESDTFQYYPRA